MAGLGRARQGCTHLVRRGGARRGPVRDGEVWCGTVWRGLVYHISWVDRLVPPRCLTSPINKDIKVRVDWLLLVAFHFALVAQRTERWSFETSWLGKVAPEVAGSNPAEGPITALSAEILPSLNSLSNPCQELFLSAIPQAFGN